VRVKIVALATHYLSSSGLSMAEISFLLGYEEPTSFYRAFRAWTGKTRDAIRSRPSEPRVCVYVAPCDAQRGSAQNVEPICDRCPATFVGAEACRSAIADLGVFLDQRIGTVNVGEGNVSIAFVHRGRLEGRNRAGQTSFTTARKSLQDDTYPTASPRRQTASFRLLISRFGVRVPGGALAGSSVRNLGSRPFCCGELAVRNGR